MIPHTVLQALDIELNLKHNPYLSFLEIDPIFDKYLTTSFIGKFYKTLIPTYGAGKQMNLILSFKRPLLLDLAAKGEPAIDEDEEEEESQRIEPVSVEFSKKKQMMKLSMALAAQIEIEGTKVFDIIASIQVKIHLGGDEAKQKLILKDI